MRVLYGFIWENHGNIWDYPLVICYIAMVKPWPIEIDGLPFLKMVDLSMAMSNNQMVSHHNRF